MHTCFTTRLQFTRSNTPVHLRRPKDKPTRVEKGTIERLHGSHLHLIPKPREGRGRLTSSFSALAIRNVRSSMRLRWN